MNGVDRRRMPVEGAAHRLEAQLLGSADFRREADPVAGESQQRRGPLLAKRHQVGNTPARDRARHRRSLGEEAIRLPGQGRDDGDDAPAEPPLPVELAGDPWQILDRAKDRAAELQHVKRTGRSSVPAGSGRSEEHTSELQSLMRISYAVFCLQKTQKTTSSQNN